jgi:hypothetical protein
MYRESLALTFQMSKYIFLIIAAFIVYYTLGEKEIWGFTGSGEGSFVVFIILAFYAHYYFIFSSLDVPKDQGKRILGFVGWSFFLFILALIPAFGVAAFFFYGVGSGGDLQEDANLDVFLSIFVASYAVCSLVVYSFLGTVLPAHVAGRKKGLKYAYLRGWEYFYFGLWRLLVGPGLILTISFIAYVSVLMIGNVPETLFVNGWVPNITTILADVILLWLQFWATIMVAWILSTVFLNSEKTEESAPLESSVSAYSRSSTRPME